MQYSRCNQLRKRGGDSRIPTVRNCRFHIQIKVVLHAFLKLFEFSCSSIKRTNGGHGTNRRLGQGISICQLKKKVRPTMHQNKERINTNSKRTLVCITFVRLRMNIPYHFDKIVIAGTEIKAKMESCHDNLNMKISTPIA